MRSHALLLISAIAVVPAYGQALIVTPSSLNLTIPGGEANALPRSLDVNSSGTPITFQVRAFSFNNWLTVIGTTPLGDGSWQATTPKSIGVFAARGSLSPGNYSGSITITSSEASNSPIVIPVSLTVGIPPTISASPSSLVLTAVAGVPGSQSGSVAVFSSDPSALAFTAGASGGNWLSVSPGNGFLPANVTVTANSSGLAAGVYSASIFVSVVGGANSPLAIPVSLTITAPATPGPIISSVVNAFGDAPVIAPNTWVAIKGSNLVPAGQNRIWAGSDFVNNQLPTQLDGVSVKVNDKNAYVYFISPTQINILTPPEAFPGAAQFQVTRDGRLSNSVSLSAQAQSPSFFEFVSADNRHYVYGRHLDGTLIGLPSSSSPAKPGETIYVAATGFGQTDVPVVAGAVTQTGNLPLPFPEVKIGGVPSVVSFAGLVGVGTAIITFTVPSELADGDHALTATYNGLSIQPNLLITIKR